MKDGIYDRHTIPRHAYDAMTSRLNFSPLKLIDSCPAKFRHWMLEGEQETTDDMLTGIATHTATYEPELFRELYCKFEGAVRKGKAWDAFCAGNLGKRPLTVVQWESALAVADAVRRDKYARKYVTEGRAELTILWTYRLPAIGGVPAVDIPMKSRPDFIAAVGAMPDLKTTYDASPFTFGKTAWNLSYVVQAALYQMGYEQVTGQRLQPRLIAAERKSPYIVQVYRVREEQLQRGRDIARQWLETYAHCRANETWPSYVEGESDLELPKWALPDDDLMVRESA